MELTFQLKKVARKLGGDRYEAEVEGDNRAFVVYFPQSITRKNGNPPSVINVTVKE